MNSLLTLLSAVAPLAFIVSLWVMAQISRRFGEVTHRPPLYRGFYVAMLLLGFPLVVRLLAIGLDDGDGLGGGTSEALLHDLPLALALTIAVVITWRYWGWLVYAHGDQITAQPRPSKR